MNNSIRSSLTALALAAFACSPLAAAAPKPLKILLVTGGCCHDYVRQKDILKARLEQRANVIVDHVHTPDKSTKPPLASLTNFNYANGYDLVIHDECAAGIDDVALVMNVLQPHLNGMPGVALHCAMHSFRVVKDYSRLAQTQHCRFVPHASDSPSRLRLCPDVPRFPARCGSRHAAHPGTDPAKGHLSAGIRGHRVHRAAGPLVSCLPQRRSRRHAVHRLR